MPEKKFGAKNLEICDLENVAVLAVFFLDIVFTNLKPTLLSEGCMMPTYCLDFFRCLTEQVNENVKIMMF